MNMKYLQGALSLAFLVAFNLAAIAESPHVFELRAAAREPLIGYTKCKASEKVGELYLSSQSVLSEEDVSTARTGDSIDSADVIVHFSEEGTRKLSAFTGNSIGSPLATIVFGDVVSAPIIRERIDSGYVSFSLNDARKARELVLMLTKSSH